MNRFVKFFCDISNSFWVHWSNFRFRKSCRFDTTLLFEDEIHSFSDISPLIKKLYSEFKYKKDGITQLGDAVLPPSEAYRRYTVDKVMTNKYYKEDCDGFHSLVYHCFKNSNLQCYLLTVNAKGCGHCVLVFRYDSVWYVVDYDTLVGVEPNLKSVIEHYNNYFKDCYSDGNKVFYNSLLKYDYKKGKFKMLNYYKTLKAN